MTDITADSHEPYMNDYVLDERNRPTADSHEAREPLTPEEEADLRRFLSDDVTPTLDETRRLLATLDAARNDALDAVAAAVEGLRLTAPLDSDEQRGWQNGVKHALNAINAARKS